MQVALFRALKSANISDDVAAIAVAAVEEHIDMTVGLAIKPLELEIAALKTTVDAKLGTMEATLQTGLKGMQSSIDGVQKYIIWLGSVMAGGVVIASGLTAYVSLIK